MKISVYDGVLSSLCSIQYITVDDGGSYNLGLGTPMAKIEITKVPFIWSLYTLLIGIYWVWNRRIHIYWHMPPLQITFCSPSDYVPLPSFLMFFQIYWIPITFYSKPTSLCGPHFFTIVTTTNNNITRHRLDIPSFSSAVHHYYIEELLAMPMHKSLLVILSVQLFNSTLHFVIRLNLHWCLLVNPPYYHTLLT